MVDFRDLKVWKRSHDLALQIYRATETFPKTEVFGLTDQMRRAAVSIPSNLAEGCGRMTQAELAQFSQVAMGSASELEYQLILAHELGYLGAEEFKSLSDNITELRKMLNKFIQTVRENKIRPTPKE